MFDSFQKFFFETNPWFIHVLPVSSCFCGSFLSKLLVSSWWQDAIIKSLVVWIIPSYPRNEYQKPRARANKCTKSSIRLMLLTRRAIIM